MGFIRITDARDGECIRMNIGAIESYYKPIRGEYYNAATRIDMIGGKATYYAFESPDRIDELIRKEERNVSLNTHDR